MNLRLQKRRIQRHRGIALIEILIVIMVSATLMGVGIGLMTLMLRLDQAARDQARWTSTLGRLADQFRQDVHAARAVREDHGRREAVELTLPGGRTVAYRGGPEKVVRRETSPPAAVREEPFAIPKGSTATFDVSRTSGQVVASLELESSVMKLAKLQIDAVVARDQRFVKEGQATIGAGDVKK